MKPRKSSQESSNIGKSKPRSIGKLFGYIKTKIKNGIEDLTSITTYSENPGKPEETVASPHTHSTCPIPRPPRRSSHSIITQKPINITHEYQQLLAIQVEKCYRNIPTKYFREDYDIGKQLFAKSGKQNNQKIFQLTDFLDQLQFNLSGLVSSKQPQLLGTLDNMNSMDVQIDALLNNLKNLRKNNQGIRLKLCGKAEKIKQLQKKQESLSLMASAMKSLKLLTFYPQEIKRTFTKDKFHAVGLYKEYIEVHEKYKSLCGCFNQRQRGCELADTTAYLKTGFQQAFSKSYWNYLSQGLFYEKDELKNIFGTKKDFQSMPGMAVGFNLAALLASNMLDQSICEEQKYQLAIKQNIEEEIKILIMAGMSLCQFDNRNLLSSLSEFMDDFEKGFLSDILTEIKQSFMMETDSHLVTQSKGIKVLLEELGPLIQKLKMNRFLKIVNFYSDIVKKGIRRSFSVLHRICRTLSFKNVFGRGDIEVLLGQVCYQIVGFADKYLSKLIQLRHVSKEIDLSTFRDLVQVFEDWQNFSEQIQQYFIIPSDYSSEFINKSMCKLNHLGVLKVKLAAEHFKGLHQNALTKQLKNEMEQDGWVEVQIDPKYYNILGYILEGQKFIQDRKRMHLLNSSLFLEKKPSLTESVNFDYFHVTHQEIVIHQKRYRTTSSLLVLLGIIEQYLKINEIDQQMSSEVSSKLVELLHFYNSFLFQLILNTAALHYNKVGHSITIRHLCLSYHAVGLVLALLNSMKSKIEDEQNLGKLLSKMMSHQQQIIKKIQSIIPYRVSQQSKSIILAKPGPSKGTQNIANYLRNINDTLRQYFQEQQIKRMLHSTLLNSFIEKLLKLKPKNKGEQQLLELEISYFLIETQFLSQIMSGYQSIRVQISNIPKTSRVF